MYLAHGVRAIHIHTPYIHNHLFLHKTLYVSHKMGICEKLQLAYWGNYNIQYILAHRSHIFYQ